MFKKLFEKPYFMQRAETCGRRKKKIILEILIFLAVFIVGSTIESAFVFIPMVREMAVGDMGRSIAEKMFEGDFFGAIDSIVFPEYILIIMLFATIGLIAAGIFYCVKLEKRPIDTMGFVKKGAVREYLIGFGIGVAMALCDYGILVLSGAGTIRFTGQFSWIMLVYLAGFIIQGMSEEILFRGYFAVTLSKGRPLWPAVLISTVFFAVAHILNPGMNAGGMLGITLVGLLLVVYMIRRGSLWGAAAMHTAWNFSISNIFNSNVAGMTPGTTLFVFEESPQAKTILGGIFSSEIGFDMVIVALVALIIIVFVPSPKEKTLY